MKSQHRWGLLGMLALAVPLVAAASVGAAEAFGDWDIYDDGGIDGTEWGAGFDESTVFDAWDADHDGRLTETEFHRGVFGAYDANDDGRLDEPEFGDYRDDAGPGGLWGV